MDTTEMPKLPPLYDMVAATILKRRRKEAFRRDCEQVLRKIAAFEPDIQCQYDETEWSNALTEVQEMAEDVLKGDPDARR